MTVVVVLSSQQMMVHLVSATVPAPTLAAQSGDTVDPVLTIVHAQDARISDPLTNSRVRQPKDFVKNAIKVFLFDLNLDHDVGFDLAGIHLDSKDSLKLCDVSRCYNKNIKAPAAFALGFLHLIVLI